MDLNDLFKLPKKRTLQEEFPPPPETKLIDVFPWKDRIGGIGSGFLNSSSITINPPVFTPPTPSFSVSFGSLTLDSTNNSPGPIFEVVLDDVNGFLLKNTTNDFTYSTLLWRVINTTTGGELPGGVNQTYDFRPNTSLTQTFQVILTAYYNGTQGQAFMTILANTPQLPEAAINGSTTDLFIDSEFFVGDDIDFRFDNTSTGFYTNAVWTSSGITLSSTTGDFVTASYTSLVSDQHQFTVTLTLYRISTVVSSVTYNGHVYIFDPDMVFSVNGVNSTFMNDSTIDATFRILTGSPVDVFNITPTQFGRKIWDLNRIILSVDTPNASGGGDSGSLPNNGFNFIPITEANPNDMIWKIRYINYKGVRLIKDAFMNVLFKRTGVPSINGVDTDQTTPMGTIDEGTIVPFSFTNTSTGTYSSFSWSATGITLNNTIDQTVTGSVTVGFPTQQPIVVTLTLFDGLDIIGTRVQTTVFNSINEVPVIASINGSTQDTTSTITGSGYSTSQQIFTNTSTGIGTTFSWSASSSSVYNQNLVQSINATTSATLMIDILMFPGIPPLVITLRIFKNGILRDTVSRTLNFTFTDGEVIGNNMVAMIDFNPVPQSLATRYQGISVLVVPNVPAIEPTKFRVETTNVVNAGTVGGFWLFQGITTGAATVRMSSDNTLTNAGGTYFWRGAVSSSPVGENMGTNVNILGPQAYSSTASIKINIEFAQPVNSINNFDQFSISVPINMTKTYITAYETYFTNSGGISDSGVLGSLNYFGPATGRYRPVLDNNTTITFKLPLGTRYVALITGALRVNNAGTIWGQVSGDGYASIYNITQFVSNTGEITFGRSNVGSGTVGSCFGFYIFNNIPIDPVVLPVASINNDASSSNTTRDTIENTVVPFSFTNTSTGTYSSFSWSATGITLNNTIDQTVTGSVTVGFPTQQPIVVTLTLFNNSMNPVSSITHTINFNVFKAVINLSLSPELLGSIPFPQTNITSGFSGQFYSGIEAFITQGLKPDRFRFALNNQGNPINGTVRIYSGSSSQGSINIVQDTSNANTTTNPRFLSLQNVDTDLISTISVPSTPFNYTDVPWTVIDRNGVGPPTYAYISNVSVSLQRGATTTYINAMDAYYSDSFNIGPSIKTQTQYFSTLDKRYIANQNGLASVTFELGDGDKYAVMIRGGVNIGTGFRWGSGIGSYASIADITGLVVNGRATLSKISGGQGTVYGFFIIKY